MDTETIVEALKEAAGHDVYVRGKRYAAQGRVYAWKTTHDAKDPSFLTVSGKVRGSRTYAAMVEFDLTGAYVSAHDCDCPYDEEACCKHAVALGVTYAESLGTSPPTSTDEASRIRSALLGAGLSADTVPQDLINRLLAYRSPPPKPKKLSAIPPKKKVPATFNPAHYKVVLTSYQNYAPTLYRTGTSFQTASARTLLKDPTLTTAQRDLLTYLADHAREPYDYRYVPPAADVSRLFPLLAAAEIPVYTGSGYNEKQRRIELAPAPLEAELVYEPRPLLGEEERIRHTFAFRMPKKYWEKKSSWDAHRPVVLGTTLLYENGATLEVHELPPLLADIVKRVGPYYDYADYTSKSLRYETALTGAEVARFEEVRAEAQRSFTLTSPPPAFTVAPALEPPRTAFKVTYDSKERSLRIAPVVDYGTYLLDISESYYQSRTATTITLVRRPPFEQPGTHIVTVEGDTIHAVPVNETLEKRFYRELGKKPAAELSFTKTLKCSRRGKAMAEYLRTTWPRLAAYAHSHGHEIRFMNEQLALEQATFRADFSATADEAIDWLYFDLTCYCGDDRVTLSRLLEFLESGETFWRRDDGTLVEIANREELERLARLLESFHARENGFEGKLRQAGELEYVMTSSPHYTAQRAKSLTTFMARAQSGKPVKKVRLPKRLAAMLRPYQKHGIDWLYFLRSHRFGGILADDMGLGKTLQALTLLWLERVSDTPSLVVCPKTLLYTWRNEAQRFFPDARVVIYEGTREERVALRNGIPAADIVVVGYALLKQDRDFFCSPDRHFNYLVLDEAQYIKNHATKCAQIVKTINADYRLALTGTPLENHVFELWSMFDFLMPGFLGSRERFALQFYRPIMDDGDAEALAYLRKKVAHFMLRRTKDEVLTELPAKVQQVSECRLTPAQSVLYQHVLAQVRSELFETVEKKGFKGAQIHILAALTKLRQVCNHPALITKGANFRELESAKLTLCMELLEEAARSGRKVLVFSQFTQMLDIIAATLEDAAIPYVYLSGKTKDRQALVDRFNIDSAVPVFLISLKAGGTGLTLTAADMVILFDPWWNPSVENQAIDRAHRIGQTKTVHVYRLITQGTIEEKIQALKHKKQQLFNAAIGESGELFSKLSWDDIRELFADA